MTDERRYKDDEVREIFGLATRRKIADPPPSVAEGLTLGEIQDIGREVGLEPTAVARAAAALDASARRLPRRTTLGMPIGVGRVVPLPRALTDAEWDLLVAELRSTFGARGRAASQGGIREWVNGNLHACVEPTEAGYRLRIGTLKGDALPLNAVGAVGLVTGAISFGALLISGGLQEAVFIPTMFGATGIAAFLANMLRLPRWANEREQQMEYIAGRVGSIVKDEANDDREP